MKVNELASALEVTADTVRFYTREGFLKPKKNKKNGYKEYDDNDLNRLRFIVCARQIGFNVSDIRDILDVADQGKTPCPLVRSLIAERLQQNEQRYKEAEKLRKTMSKALIEWNNKPNRAPTGHMICHLIENFSH